MAGRLAKLNLCLLFCLMAIGNKPLGIVYEDDYDNKRTYRFCIEMSFCMLASTDMVTVRVFDVVSGKFNIFGDGYSYEQVIYCRSLKVSDDGAL
jgi:hypothetical protein